MTQPTVNHEAWRSIHGHYYDWQETLQPESPYIHDYSKTLTMKLAMAIPDGEGGTNVYCTFQQALRYIQITDIITRGIPKIIYLVGWQYNGHDDKYPSWDEVNYHLKRPQDQTARDSYLWLTKEARHFNTTVSVHVNMTDAYDNSPHWDQYIQHDLIARNEDGSLIQIGSYNDRLAYQICYKHEWESGVTVERIEKLISLLQLDTTGTVHLDAYFPKANIYRGISQEEESSYMRRTIRYFRQRGIDVTSENFAHLRNDPFIGLQAWCWWFDQTNEQDFLARPAHLLSGAAIRDYSISGFPVRTDLEFLFGAGMHGEDIYLDFTDRTARFDWHKLFIERFCLNMLQYQYLNSLERIRLEHEEDDRVMYYSEGHSVHLSDRSIRCNGRLLREGDNVLFPTLWQAKRELIAYSKLGYTAKTWMLPPEWIDVTAFDVYIITVDGMKVDQLSQPITNGEVLLTLAPGMAVSIFPSANGSHSLEGVNTNKT